MARGKGAGRRGQADDGDHRHPDGEGGAIGASTLALSGYDAPNKIVGGGRHLLTDTIGMLLAVVLHSTSMRDSNGAEPSLHQVRRLFPFLERIIGDPGYQEPKMAAAVARTDTQNIDVVRRCDRHKFVVLPKHWIVERTIGWISRSRRLARDLEGAVAGSRAPSFRLPLCASCCDGWPQTPRCKPKFPGRALNIVPIAVLP